jgi:hypothetical protein
MAALGFQLPRTKNGTRTKCILHGGDRDSFAFNELKGTWFCHRCTEGGGKIKLVQRALGVDTRGALRWIADLAGMPLDRWSSKDRQEYARRRESSERQAELIAHFLFLERWNEWIPPARAAIAFQERCEADPQYKAWLQDDLAQVHAVCALIVGMLAIAQERDGHPSTVDTGQAS